jgi:hypothetical protein
MCVLWWNRRTCKKWVFWFGFLVHKHIGDLSTTEHYSSRGLKSTVNSVCVCLCVEFAPRHGYKNLKKTQAEGKADLWPLTARSTSCISFNASYYNVTSGKRSVNGGNEWRIELKMAKGNNVNVWVSSAASNTSANKVGSKYWFSVYMAQTFSSTKHS